MPDERDARDRYYRVLLNTIPAALFVVDDKLMIHDFNDAAQETFGLLPSKVLNRRGGEVLQCLHATDVPEGCTKGPVCRSCVIKNSVTDSLSGQHVTRRRMRVVLVSGDQRKDVDLLVTSSPLPKGEAPLSLLVLEDVSQIIRQWWQISDE